MGFEHQIQYQPKDRNVWDQFVSRLDNPQTNGWPAYQVLLTEAGVYFCDNDRSEASALALRRIVDEILAQGQSVTIEEL